MIRSFYSFLVPGQIVSHPQCPEWGAGQVQSVVENRVTVNFEHKGKVLVDISRIDLDVISSPDL
ncbi:DUF3553 domain-containing protein [Swingsia samuiensis]|uniref:DUF3553 domain-containing protein n=1 Tax=Swingsia samuiensis TaxID=1293412 RepID=A0A4Y6UIC5_9PROT|nr:DUF3553 domain-containing protein [Swingsia samuiensis]QDH16167.1 DUF3553 domain-containing protein [Swingsia samuiensis]